MESLPFDLILSIASYLPCEDYENLSHVSRHIQDLLNQEEIARACLKVSGEVDGMRQTD